MAALPLVMKAQLEQMTLIITTLNLFHLSTYFRRFPENTTSGNAKMIIPIYHGSEESQAEIAPK
jgi:hypothetical protein